MDRTGHLIVFREIDGTYQKVGVVSRRGEALTFSYEQSYLAKSDAAEISLAGMQGWRYRNFPSGSAGRQGRQGEGHDAAILRRRLARVVCRR